ncbi:EAL domain-containing protein [Aliarcobacter skirrowii]|uniref:EAL domain-containing protein n=5 Tax=Aliarcobacter skirrowii TaxID=28200 RepID=UPI0029B1647B|nr:EAL domain-containing protein [Aliarcobacter skirrowii]MDX4067106.1 EAL domain-containing protein [Aliarcobacter skirrowii]
MKLKTKSLINITISTALVFFLSGYFTFNYFENILKQQIIKDIENDSKKIQNFLSNIEKNQLEVINSIEDDDKILSILNLISNYEDKTYYSDFIFNTEKESLIQYSQKFAKDGENILIEFFDKDNSLIAKKSFNKRVDESVYVIYDDGNAFIKNLKDKTLTPLENKINKCLGTNYNYINNYYTICHKKELKQDSSILGYVKISYFLNQEELEKLNLNLNYPLFLNQGNQEYEFYLKLNGNKDIYLIHNVDMSSFYDKKEELILNMFISILLLIILFSIVSTLFINKNILKPLFKLKSTLESVLNKKYKPIEIINDDEIGEIFKASNKIFEKLWDNYSNLQSYEKSIDTSNLVTKFDTNGYITYANKFFCDITGYEKKDLIGKTHEIIRHYDMPDEFFEDLWKTIKQGIIWRNIIKNRTKENGYYWADTVISPIIDINRVITGYIAVSRDITDFVHKNEELEYRANYDLLTSQYSRNKLLEDIEKFTSPILIVVNIDRFLQINDLFGHKFGDEVLKKFSQFLKSESIKEFKNFDLYRYGGDEFAILLENYNKDSLLSSVRNILRNLENKIIVIEDKEVNLNLSCGISFEKTDILLSAEMALQICKKNRVDLVVYDENITPHKEYKNNILWSNKIKKAIEEDRVILFFQAIVNNKNLKYEKYEVLIRIKDTDDNIISPFFFLDIAKKTKQYLKLTKIVIDKSFEMFKDKEVEFSINLTNEDISNKEINDYIFKKFDEYPNIAKKLVIELVESESIVDYKIAIEFIKRVKSKGCKIAIDDFGSGYSNFEYLVKLEADYIKIDGSLIKNIVTQKESFAVVSTIVNFAKQMEIKTIAEFVENEEIYKIIKNIGVDFSQGYYFTQPKKELEQ